MSGRLGIRRHGIGWQARYRLADGRERARTFDTLDEAVAWRTERLAERNRGVRYDPASSRITFGQLAERWASTQIGDVDGNRASTRARDLSYLRNRLLPCLGGVPLDSLTKTLLQRWVNDLSGNSASETVHKAAQIAAKVLDLGIEEGRLLVNHARGLKLPEIRRDEARFLTPREVLTLEDAVGTVNDHYVDLVPFMVDSAARIGELAGARVRDVDLKRGVFHVRQIVVEVPKKVSGATSSLLIGPPKTAAGRRTIPTLTPEVLGRVEERVRRLNLRPDDLLFAGWNGAPMRPNRFRQRVWNPAVSVADLEEPLPTPHALRHTGVAHWIAAGETNYYRMTRWAGHTSTSTFLRLYGHLLPEDVSETVSALAEMRQRARDARPTPGKELP